ncbi:MAG: SPOR domain-containing protein, partial [Gemmatimonadaceae bacterium]
AVRESAAAAPAAAPAPADTSTPAPPPAPAAPAASSAVPEMTLRSATGATMRLVNPGDSAQAARYSVQLVAANTLEGAYTKRREAGWLPAATISPMTVAPQGVRWFRLTVGAYVDRPSAEAYMATLRNRGKLAADAGTVVEVPFAVLLDSMVPASGAPRRVSAYLARGLPAYGLRQDDGTARIFAGAFETAFQATLLADKLKANGLAPVVAYRTGRPF